MKIKAFGTTVVIHYTFVVFVALCFLTDNTALAQVMLFASLHELAHIICLMLLGGKVDSISLSFVGVGLRHSTCFSYGKECLFLLSGIFVNGLFWVAGISADINGALFLINALPIYPLDGGRALKLVLNSLFDLKLSDRIYYFVSLISITVLFIYSVIAGNVSFLIITVYAVIYSLCNSYD